MSNVTLGDLGTVSLDLSKNLVQQKFLASNARFQNFSGGFGSGKTTACCLKGQLLSALFPNNLGCVVRKTYPDLRDTTRKTFLEILPESWVKGWKESENALTLKNNSVILFRHFENGRVKVGASLGWFFLDQAEEAEEEIFKGLVGRLRRNVPRRFGLMAMNPNGQDWQYRLFVKDQGKNPNFEHFDSTTYDNQANLPAGYIEDMIATFPQEWIERYVYGKWSRMSGLIFHEFSEDENMVDPFDVPKDWPKVRGMDWGVDAPATALFIAQDPQSGVYHVFDEYGDSQKTPEEHASAILDKSRTFGSIRATLIDRTTFHRESDLKSVADRYRTAGLMCLPATGDLMASVLLVKQLLKTGKIKFHRGKTDRTITEMKSWKWGPRRNGKEMPANGDDHFLDGLRYGLYWMDRKNFVQPHEEKYKRVPLEGLLTPGGRNYLMNSDPITGLPS